MEDETAQLKGACDVVYCPGSLFKLPTTLSKYGEMMNRSDSMITALPCRITTLHFCYDDSGARVLLDISRNLINKEIRLRMRPHFGTSMEYPLGAKSHRAFSYFPCLCVMQVQILKSNIP